MMIPVDIGQSEIVVIRKALFVVFAVTHLQRRSYCITAYLVVLLIFILSNISNEQGPQEH